VEKTLRQFDQIMDQCQDIFLAKQADYGTSWRIFRPSSLTDQLYIKAKRLRTIEEMGRQKVDDPIDQEYMGLINYSILALLQLQLPVEAPLELPFEQIKKLYEQERKTTRELLARKNHDYGEVWRDLRLSSITDLILAKLLRIRRIEDNDGATLASEGIESNLRDIINYAVFALILLMEAGATQLNTSEA
jgi:hypothetical protein